MSGCSFPPFTWLFRFMYWAAVQVSTLYLRTVSGVIAIYPSGSLSRGGLICGLSDIDFKIFVAGTRKKDIYEEIINRLNRLEALLSHGGCPG